MNHRLYKNLPILFSLLALSCSRLSKPEFGTILPENCMVGKTFAGERCFLHCASGYKPLGKRVTVCNSEIQWHPQAELQCVPVRNKMSKLSVMPATAPPIKPTIKCPEDMTVVKPRNLDTILVRIEKPVTNVDWNKYVDSHPSWGKHLEATLSLGTTEITYRARSIHSNTVDICRVLIHVIGKFQSKNIQL